MGGGWEDVEITTITINNNQDTGERPQTMAACDIYDVGSEIVIAPPRMRSVFQAPQ